MIKKIFFILVILGGYLFYWPQIALAQDGGVNMKARVLERKFTDTINDFTVDGQDYSRTPYKAVLGASTNVPSNQNGPLKNNFKFHWQYLLFLLPIGGLYWLAVHLKKSKPPEECPTYDVGH